jgi:hypothetical protein
MKKSLILLTVLVAPFGVVGFFQSLTRPIPLTTLILLITVIITWLLNILEDKIYITSMMKKVVLLIMAPVLLSILIGLPSGLYFGHSYISYDGYILESMGRYINLFLLPLFFLGVGSYCYKSGEKFQYNVIKFYWLGCLILCIFGIWQAFHFYLGVPFFEIDTRSHVHSVPSFLIELVPGRLTSLANEPSFFVPFIIDAFLLTIFMVKRKITMLFLSTILFALLILTFSPAGYFNGLILIIVILLFFAERIILNKSINKASLILSFLSVTAIIIVIIFGLLDYTQIVTFRLSYLLDTTEHARAFMIFMPFVWLMSANPLNILFGFGPKSYAFIGNLVGIFDTDNPVHVTSNNLLTDFVWETGLVGLICVVCLFLFLFSKSLNKKSRYKKNNYVALMLTMHLFITSIYRGEFFALRFWVILLIVVLLTDNSFMKSRVNDEPKLILESRRCSGF